MTNHINHTVVYPKTRTTRELRKRADLEGEGTGYTSVPDGTEEIYYETSINIEALHNMARRAAQSAGQVCNDGALRVKIISRKRVHQPGKRLA